MNLIPYTTCQNGGSIVRQQEKAGAAAKPGSPAVTEQGCSTGGPQWRGRGCGTADVLQVHLSAFFGPFHASERPSAIVQELEPHTGCHTPCRTLEALAHMPFGMLLPLQLATQCPQLTGQRCPLSPSCRSFWTVATGRKSSRCQQMLTASHSLNCRHNAGGVLSPRGHCTDCQDVLQRIGAAGRRGFPFWCCCSVHSTAVFTGGLCGHVG